MRFDLALRLLDLAREHAALDDLAFLHAGELQQPLGAGRIAEDAHQVVFHRQIEAARARIALAARAAAQLIVDAARFVAFGADDVQAAGRDHLIVALLPGRRAPRRAPPRRPPRGSVRPAPPRDCRRARCRCRARPCWSRWSRSPGRPACATTMRLALVLLGIEHLVRDVLLAAAGRTGTRRSRSRWCRPAPAARAARSP